MKSSIEQQPVGAIGTACDRRLPRVLIGPLSSDPAESVSGVNRAFLQGLAERYSFVSLGADRSRGGTRQSRLNGINTYYFLRQIVQWSWRLIKYRPSLAHYAVSSGWAMEKGLMFMGLARFAGARTLAHLHSGGFVDHWQSLPNWRRRLATRQFAKLDGLVLASDWWRQEIARHLPLPPEKLFTVNNPIDGKFEKAALEMPLERSGNVVLALGVLGRAKGIFDILAAAEMVSRQPGLKLTVAGAEREPNIARDAREYVASHTLAESVEIRTAINDSEKVQLFREASILVLPSYYENFPLVILEAAAAGLAIVTTPVGAVPEFFQDRVSALFIQPGKPAELAAALKVLLESPAERRRLGEAARQVFRTRLARSKIMDSLDSVYRQILAT